LITRPVALVSEAPRAALHDLSIALARHPDVVEFSRALVEAYPARDRLSRLAAVFTFVGHLVDAPLPADGELRDGVDFLLLLAGEEEGPAVILSALLQSLGERAVVDYAPGMAFVRVELDAGDLAGLPPHAGLFMARGRYYLPLDARQARSPLGFLPRSIRETLRRT
jgi:hypothetical protein